MIRSLLEILLLSFTIFAESSGESFDGRLAVGSVIRNRVNCYNKTYSDIILQKNQFSCWNSKEISKHIKRIEYKPFKECLLIAKDIYFNNTKDNTQGSLYYTRKRIKRSWMNDMKIVLVIDNHKFMK